MCWFKPNYDPKKQTEVNISVAFLGLFIHSDMFNKKPSEAASLRKFHCILLPKKLQDNSNTGLIT